MRELSLLEADIDELGAFRRQHRGGVPAREEHEVARRQLDA
ncbi:hypothetical protein ACFPRL_15490 [Pseudoclavibacter helvolus]